MAGLPALRRDWIIGRGDVEEYDARAIQPEDNGLKGPDRSGGVQPFPNTIKRPLRAKAGANVSQMHYARRGIISTEEHTSELQSLMRHAYAVFCLKKNKQTKTSYKHTHE